MWCLQWWSKWYIGRSVWGKFVSFCLRSGNCQCRRTYNHRVSLFWSWLVVPDGEHFVCVLLSCFLLKTTELVVAWLSALSSPFSHLERKMCAMMIRFWWNCSGNVLSIEDILLPVSCQCRGLVEMFAPPAFLHAANPVGLCTERDSFLVHRPIVTRDSRQWSHFTLLSFTTETSADIILCPPHPHLHSVLYEWQKRFCSSGCELGQTADRPFGCESNKMWWNRFYRLKNELQKLSLAFLRRFFPPEARVLQSLWVPHPRRVLWVPSTEPTLSPQLAQRIHVHRCLNPSEKSKFAPWGLNVL